jgi:hypothetical protein
MRMQGPRQRTTAAAHKLPVVSADGPTGCHCQCIHCYAAGRRTATTAPQTSVRSPLPNLHANAPNSPNHKMPRRAAGSRTVPSGYFLRRADHHVRDIVGLSGASQKKCGMPVLRGRSTPPASGPLLDDGRSLAPLCCGCATYQRQERKGRAAVKAELSLSDRAIAARVGPIVATVRRSPEVASPIRSRNRSIGRSPARQPLINP